MDEMTCPQCQDTMTPKTHADVIVYRCDGCQGVFLSHATLGALVEAENDWHSHQSASTTAMPRITASMTTPPVQPPRARGYVETLFSD